MIKNYKMHDEEIDLIEIMVFIWKGRFKIILITLISFLIGVGYDKLSPNLYHGSLEIKPSKNSEFREFININNTVINYEGSYLSGAGSFKMNQGSVINRFVKEFMDYEELISVLENIKYIKEEVSQLSYYEKREKLYSYAVLFTVKTPEKRSPGYFLKFEWHDLEEGKYIMEQAFKLTSENLNKIIFDDLNEIVKTKRKIARNNDQDRINYLKEQSAIAKELGLENSQVSNLNLAQAQANFSFNINNTDVAYYLRGYKAIDMEILLIKSRDYQKLSDTEKKINNLNTPEIKWIDYNIFLLNYESMKNSSLISLVSILLGLIIGILYVSISNINFSNKKNRNKN